MLGSVSAAILSSPLYVLRVGSYESDMNLNLRGFKRERVHMQIALKSLKRTNWWVGVGRQLRVIIPINLVMDSGLPIAEAAYRILNKA